MDYGEAVIRNLKDRTGKSLEGWVAVINKYPDTDRRARVNWLREKHGLSMPISELVTRTAEGEDMHSYEPDAYVEKMFSGPKAALLPIYEKLLKAAFALGKDVTVTPCTTIVPFRRKHVIAQVKPSTTTRIDFGFALKDHPFTDRLQDTGGRAKGDRITHKVALTTVAEIDKEVLGWLKKAYELDA